MNRAGNVGNITFEILLDDKQVLHKELRVAKLPLAIKMPLNGSRRMEIRLDSANDGFTGDSVLLNRPRIRK